MNLRRHWALAAALAVVVATNAVVLAGAAYNRSGAPEATLQLSERELSLPRFQGRHENSGLALGLEWRVLDARPEVPGPFGPPSWLDERKMLELGFKPYPPSQDVGRDRFQRQVSRDVLLVLELEGDAYRESMRRAEAEVARMQGNTREFEQAAAAKRLARERMRGSRLFVVDAGLDAGALRAKYPDRSRYAIVSGRIAPSWSREHRGGMVSAVSVDSITVPLEYRPVFAEALDRAAGRYDPDAPLTPYLVSVAFGRRLEPWILAATRTH